MPGRGPPGLGSPHHNRRHGGNTLMATPLGARDSADMRLRRGARKTTTHPQVLTGARLVLPTGTVPNGRITIDGTKITAEAPHGIPQGNATVIDVTGHWLVPGFIDL